jgi:mannonate dehydratase
MTGAARAAAARVALGQLADPTDEMLTFAVQLGLSGVSLNTPALPGEHRWEAADLAALRERVESRGLHLESIENVPNRFYARAMLGLPGADDDLEHMAATIANIGAAGIGVLGLTFLPTSVWRTAVDLPGRGGALVSAFDAGAVAGGEVYVARRDRQLDDPFVRGATLVEGEERDDEAMWRNFEVFASALGPVAEAAGVRIALHPDDPPVPRLGGIARILRDVDGLERAVAIGGSSFGVNLCLGTISSAGGEAAVLDAIDRFGPAGNIVYVHFRDVLGTVPTFREAFLGEGNYSPPRVMSALLDNGFDGFILDDHVPRVVGDTAYAHRARAHAIGYLQALLDAHAEARSVVE